MRVEALCATTTWWYACIKVQGIYIVYMYDIHEWSWTFLEENFPADKVLVWWGILSTHDVLSFQFLGLQREDIKAQLFVWSSGCTNLFGNSSSSICSWKAAITVADVFINRFSSMSSARENREYWRRSPPRLGLWKPGKQGMFFVFSVSFFSW